MKVAIFTLKEGEVSVPVETKTVKFLKNIQRDLKVINPEYHEPILEGALAYARV